jgi:hypothetical protein
MVEKSYKGGGGTVELFFTKGEEELANSYYNKDNVLLLIQSEILSGKTE